MTKRQEMIRAAEIASRDSIEGDYISPKQSPPGRKSIQDKRAEIVRKEMEQIKKFEN